MVRLLCSPVISNDGSASVYALLSFAFRREFGCDMPEIRKTPVGKPYFPTMPDIHFSLSHSRTHVLCGLSDRPIGVDIESPRELRRRVIEFFTAPEEALLFAPLELWVLKESYIKLIGGSLPLVKTIHFSRRGDQIVAPDAPGGALGNVTVDDANIGSNIDSNNASIDGTGNRPGDGFDDTSGNIAFCGTAPLPVVNSTNKPSDNPVRKHVSAKLYTVASCTAAVCISDHLYPDSIELIIGTAALI